MIDVTLLGTSALVPLPDRAETAALVTVDGHSVLFDCGEGTQTAAAKAGVSLMKTGVIALTHYHGDHVFGLPGLCQTMGVMGRTDPLTVVGPGDIRRELAHIMGLIGYLPYEIRLMTLPADGIALSDLSPAWRSGARLVPFETDHRVVSQGYALVLPRAGRFMPDRAKALGIPVDKWKILQKGENITVGDRVITPDMVMGAPRRGLKVVFSGDTTVCESLGQAARDADLFMCEATYGEDGQAELAADHGHMTFTQAARTAANAGAKRLWLMHYSQMIKDPAEYLPNAKSVFENTECGCDGMHITLEFEE